MKEFHSFLQYLDFIKDNFSNDIALSTATNTGYDTITYSTLVNDSKKLAKYFISRGISKGSKVALISENNLEWSRYAFATILAQAVLVPIDVALSANEISNLITHVEPDLIIHSLDSEKVALDSLDIYHLEVPLLKMTNDFSIYPIFKNIRLEDSDLNRMALIVYTSGTSGRPKGVMTSERAILFEVEAIKNRFKVPNRIKTLSMLPINHLLEFTIGLCANLSVGAEICILKKIEIEKLKHDLKHREITQMITVPLLTTKIKEGILKNIKDKGKAVQVVFYLLLKFSHLIRTNKSRRKFFSFIHKNLGQSLEYIIVGSAKAPVKDISFFKLLGIEIYEGYGLTETAPVISTNAPGNISYGSTGKVLEGVEVRISTSDDLDRGEIQVRGDNIMMGYYKNPALTKKTFTPDRWFKTGDIGHLDNKGYLTITGRIKNLIVLDGGKKVHPEEINEHFTLVQEIKEICVCGISVTINNKVQTQVAYVLVPSDDFIELHNKDWNRIEDDLIKVLEDVKKKITYYKRPHKTFISKDELPKTTTRKIKQSKVKSQLEKIVFSEGPDNSTSSIFQIRNH